MSYRKPDLSHLSDEKSRELVKELCEVVWLSEDGWHPDNECEIAEVIYLLNRFNIACSESGDEEPYVVSTVTGEKVYLTDDGETVDTLYVVLDPDEVHLYGLGDFEMEIEKRLGVEFVEMAYGLDQVTRQGDLSVWVSGKVRR